METIGSEAMPNDTLQGSSATNVQNEETLHRYVSATQKSLIPEIEGSEATLASIHRTEDATISPGFVEDTHNELEIFYSSTPDPSFAPLPLSKEPVLPKEDDQCTVAEGQGSNPPRLTIHGKDEIVGSDFWGKELQLALQATPPRLETRLSGDWVSSVLKATTGGG